MSTSEQQDITDESVVSTNVVAVEPATNGVVDSSKKRKPRGPLQHFLGGGCIVGSVIITFLLWFLFRPAGQPDGRYLGEILGTTSIVLFSCSLLLATRAPFLESFFGGLDVMYNWHRWCAIVGIMLLFPHYILVKMAPKMLQSNSLADFLGFVALFFLVVLVLWALIPRLPVVGRRIRAHYQSWFLLHRFTGLFVIVALVHGLLATPILQQVPVLLYWYGIVAIIGTVAYLYRELLHPFIRQLWQRKYVVEEINHLNRNTFEVILAPVDQPVSFLAGQFVFVRFGGGASWEPHPFTVSSAPEERLLHLSIKALGDHTQYLLAAIQPGIPATVGLAFGRFDYQSGGRKQVWIAGGIGITPFRSWIRAFSTDEPLDFDIDLFYTVHNEDEALFLDELRTAAAHHETFRPHITFSEREGSLTIEQIVQRCSGPITEREVYMCGAIKMTEQFQQGLRKLGVPSEHIHQEYFNFR